jgi:hypothetical protein
MDDLEILIQQNKMNFDEMSSLLEALLVQTKDNNTDQILETIINQNEQFVQTLKDVKKGLTEKNNDDVVAEARYTYSIFGRVNNFVYWWGNGRYNLGSNHNSYFK